MVVGLGGHPSLESRIAPSIGIVAVEIGLFDRPESADSRYRVRTQPPKKGCPRPPDLRTGRHLQAALDSRHINPRRRSRRTLGSLILNSAWRCGHRSLLELIVPRESRCRLGIAKSLFPLTANVQMHRQSSCGALSAVSPRRRPRSSAGRNPAKDQGPSQHRLPAPAPALPSPSAG